MPSPSTLLATYQWKGRFELFWLIRQARGLLTDLDGREPEGILEVLDELDELTALTEEPSSSLSEAEERQ